MTRDPAVIARRLVALWRQHRQAQMELLLEELALCVEEAQDAISGRLPTRAARERAKRDPLGPYVLDEWIPRP